MLKLSFDYNMACVGYVHQISWNKPSLWDQSVVYFQIPTSVQLFQLFFVVSAFTSDSARPDVSDLCAAMALLFHYFWLSQFTWMLAVGIHLLQVQMLTCARARV